MATSSPQFVSGMIRANPASITTGRNSLRKAVLSLKRNAALTLVEVVLAIGIIPFAFIPLIGMLPVGIDMSRQAIDTTVQSQIVQQLTTEALQTDFSNLSTLASNSTRKPYYFDDQGNKVSDDNAAGSIYTAAISASTNTALPGSVTTQKLSTVTICVLNTKSNRTSSLADLTLNPDAKKYVVLIPDNGL